jgi:hypothetical protein
MRYDLSAPGERRVENLRMHPLNKKIYGDSIPDASLINSVKDNGVFNPVILNQDGLILSGTRRWLAAKKAGLVKVPTIRFLGKSELVEELFLIESNRQRVKTEGQIAREASELLRIESELAKTRKAAGIDLPVKSSGGNGDVRDKVANTLGIGGSKVDQAVAIVRAAEAGDEIAKQELRKLDNNEISVNAAHKAIQKEEKKKVKSEHQKLAGELQKLFGKTVEVQTSKDGKFNLFFFRIEEKEVRRIARVV